MWTFEDDFRKKLQAILDEPDASTHLEAIMGLVRAEIEAIEEAHWYDQRELEERD
jgi:hypothetical protein